MVALSRPLAAAPQAITAAPVRPRARTATLVAMNDGVTMALRDVKNHLSEVVDQVEREQARIVVTRHGKAAAVLVSADDLASLEETLEVMSRSSLMAQLRDSLAEIAAGDAEVLSKDELLQTLRA